MPEVMTSARTPAKPALEPVAHPGCRICAAADRGRSASRIRGNEGGIQRYSGIIETHPHRGNQAEDKYQGTDQADAEPIGSGEDSPLMATLRERVSEENGMRRSIRLDP
ncbi:hypothetical protein ACFCV8_17280 [Streptomyces sp. NPDC056347]|uniref:hypothetical protein n=1 Tax=Streptomyces sp. NPDC056347 TaxID=3345790 RepID=UPI0035E2B349